MTVPFFLLRGRKGNKHALQRATGGIVKFPAMLTETVHRPLFNANSGFLMQIEKVPIDNKTELPWAPLAGLYTASLGGKPGAIGYFDLGTGRMMYYNDGGEWFFERETGTPVFYIRDGAIHWAIQRLAG